MCLFLLVLCNNGTLIWYKSEVLRASNFCCAILTLMRIISEIIFKFVAGLLNTFCGTAGLAIFCKYFMVDTDYQGNPLLPLSLVNRRVWFMWVMVLRFATLISDFYGFQTATREFDILHKNTKRIIFFIILSWKYVRRWNRSIHEARLQFFENV